MRNLITSLQTAHMGYHGWGVGKYGLTIADLLSLSSCKLIGEITEFIKDSGLGLFL